MNTSIIINSNIVGSQTNLKVEFYHQNRAIILDSALGSVINLIKKPPKIRRFKFTKLFLREKMSFYLVEFFYHYSCKYLYQRNLEDFPEY